MMFSTVLRHPLSLSQTAPVVFIQYLAALAIVEGIHTYEPGYQALPVKLKWPNDIYALDPGVPSPTGTARDYVKVGGILVNSSYAGGDYTLVAGVGLNVANAAPTTSVNALAKKAGLPPFQTERLLARMLNCFERIYETFRRDGWGRELEGAYYRDWLHA